MGREQFREVVLIEHKGVAKMVGKCFWVALTPGGEQAGLIFLHAESGSQWHWQTDAPGGYDRPLLEHLRELGVLAIHHHKQGGEGAGLYVARLETMLRRGRYPGPMDTRDRLFLSRPYWRYWPAGPWYAAPWVAKRHEVLLRATERDPAAVLPAPSAPAPGKQGILWGERPSP